MADKIVIVSGQEFTVPAETDNEVIRSQLAAQGFPDVASATIQKGKKKIGDVEHDTIEFVKKAGTKGMDGTMLAEALSSVPGTRSGTISQVIQRLTAGELTFAEAIDDDQLWQALNDITRIDHSAEELCRTLAALPAVADSAPRAW